MPDARLVERIWFGRGIGAAAVRAALLPLEVLYRAVTAVRGALYDRRVLPSHALGVPVVSVGNLSVGGTGKTPVASWLAGELQRRGAQPAVILRGYGVDEPLVHSTLNPSIPVIVGQNRVRGAERARSLGADVLVLDDAFQHRRARRDVDVVLVSAERWTASPRLLPAGPWREPLSALRRASLVIITRKSVPARDAEAVRAALHRAAPGVPTAVVHLEPGELRGARGAATRPLDDLRGRHVLAIAAVGDPQAFFAQLAAAGARVDAAAFPDHHRFTVEETRALAARAVGADLAVCTLKDAVKLDPDWPREAPPLWYVSQRVRPERGVEELDELLGRLLRARRPNATDSAGPSAGDTSEAHGH